MRSSTNPPTIPKVGHLSTLQRVEQKARALGFDAARAARADVALEDDFVRYEEFLAQELHGEMRFLAEPRAARRRLDGPEVLDGARSVVCVASRYQRAKEQEDAEPPLARAIARYARGRDYHNSMRRKLRQLAAFVRTLGEGVRARPLLDVEPVLERAWARRAGLGFVGKNGMLIVPGLGSMVLLGEVVTTLDLLAPEEGADCASPVPLHERCGSCTLCLDACPSKALVRPFVLDARRCVSYLTIELRGPVPDELREAMGEHLFGCDDCQTVCPFCASPRPLPSAARFAPHERWAHLTIEDLLDPSRWAEVSEGSPLYRATPEGLARSAAIVLGNRRDPASRAALERARREHPSAVVRAAASWALSRL